MMKLRIMLLSPVLVSMLIVLPSAHAQKVEQKGSPGFPCRAGGMQDISPARK